MPTTTRRSIAVASRRRDDHDAPRPRREPSTLVAEGVSAWFGDHQVLDDVNLEMPGGQVTALIGPSGCGKSTFLRILNRMHELVPGASLAGEVLLDGEDIYDHGRRPIKSRRQIGMVFQKANPFPTMSVYDNVLAGLVLTGRKTRNTTDLVESSLRQRRPVERGQGPAGNPRLVAVGWPAAAAVHRPRPRGAARACC